jgi:hypothetical protein
MLQRVRCTFQIINCHIYIYISFVFVFCFLAIFAGVCMYEVDTIYIILLHFQF